MSRYAEPNPNCLSCRDYLDRRAGVLPNEIVATAVSSDVDARDLLVAYMRAVHDRHLSGLSLDVQP